MGKIVQISETKLIHLIKEVLMVEFASNGKRQRLIKHFINKFPVYLENWCLCFYCNNVQMCREYRHWKTELIAAFIKESKYNLKNDIKYHALIEASSELKRLDVFKRNIINKFDKEQLEYDNALIDWMFDEFNNETHNVLIAIANGETAYIEYINNIFPNF